MSDTHKKVFGETPVGILSSAGIDPTTCLGAWDFRGATAARRLKDKSFSGNNGTNNGATLANGSATFAGDDFISFAGTVSLRLDNLPTFSLVAVLKPGTVSGDNAIMGSRYTILAFRDGNRFEIQSYDESYRYGIYNVSYNTSTIYTVVATYDGSNLRIYVNGNIGGTMHAYNYASSSNSSTMYIGGYNRDGSLIWPGQFMSYFNAVTSTALTQAQITKLHQILSARYPND